MTESESFKRGISPQSAWPWRTSEDSMTPILTDEDLDKLWLESAVSPVENGVVPVHRTFARAILSRLGGGEAVAHVRIDSGEVHVVPKVRDAEASALRDGQALYTSPQVATPAAPSAMPGDREQMTPREVAAKALAETSVPMAQRFLYAVKTVRNECGYSLLEAKAIVEGAAAMGGEGKANG